MDDASNPFAPLTPAELAEAARQSEPPEAENGAPPTCPPADAEPGAMAAARLYGRKPHGLWRYATADDETAFYAARWNEAEGKKTFRPLSWRDGAGWQFVAWPDHRPLFNLPDLVSKPKAPVVICEGEKAAEAAAAIFPNSIVTTVQRRRRRGGQDRLDATRGPVDFDLARSRWGGRKIRARSRDDSRGARLFGCHHRRQGAGGDRSGRRRSRSPRQMGRSGRNGGMAGPCRAAQGGGGAAQGFRSRPGLRVLRRLRDGAEGLHVEVEKRRGEAKTKASEWVAAPFEILGACRDPGGRGWGKYLRWRDGDGRAHLQHVTEAALQGDPAPLCASLVDGGLRINRAQQRALANYLSGARVVGRVTIVLRTGWHEVGGQSVFVLPRVTLGPRGSETVILDGAAHGPYDARGSLEDWQAGVGTLASGHVLPVLAISAAVAGPLLHLAGQEGGGLHFHGQSSRGKTTLLQAAASVWGRGGSPGYVKAWRATANGLEGAAASGTDTVLILDEFGQVDGREAGAVLYSLSNGAGKVRAVRDGAMREPKSWRVMVLSTGEITVASKLVEDRAGKPRAGQFVRMLDIPADRGFGVFDHAGPDDDAGKLAKALKQSAISAYGVAGPEFVRRLINERVTGDDVRSQVGEFVSAYVPAGADGQVDRAAQRLGLIATAGELATLLGVTPWREGEVTAAANWALEQWISQRGGTEPAEARLAVEQVRRFIEAHGDYRFEPLDNVEARAVPNRAGWRKGEGLEREWLIPSETWRGEICAGLDPKLVARTLWQAGILRRGSDGFQQVRTIDGASKRVFVIGAAIFDGGGHEG